VNRRSNWRTLSPVSCAKILHSNAAVLSNHLSNDGIHFATLQTGSRNGPEKLLRRNRELHKRLMVLAMVILIVPAIGRLPSSPSAIGWVILGFSLLTVLYDALFLRRVYLINIAGVLLINIASPLRFMIAGSPAWQSFAHWIGH
jgi:hypothetical protein